MDAVGDREMAGALGGLGRPEMAREIAYAPELHPALYESVLRRRVIAFVLDMAVVSVLTLIAGFVVTMLGLVTFGLGWLLYPALLPVIVLGYAGWGAARFSATPGMRLLGLTMRGWSGGAVDALVGALHALLYWVSVSILTPLAALFGLFNPRKRLLHDIVAGVVVMDARALARVEA